MKDLEGKDHLIQLNYNATNKTHRINLPNKLPGIDWVRKNKRGILIIKKNSTHPNYQISVEISPNSANKIVRQSRVHGVYNIDILRSKKTRRYGVF